MAVVYLGLGSNLGDRLKYIQDALKLLERVVTIERISTIAETKPVGGPPQDNYLNAVVRITTILSAHKLLEATQRIEQVLGRTRTVQNGPRTIDIDILLYDDMHLHDKDLTIPHPRMFAREFVMTPLKEIDPNLVQHLTQGLA